MGGVPIVDTTNRRSAFQLPTTRFHLLSDVVPVIAEEGPVNHHAPRAPGIRPGRRGGRSSSKRKAP
jgi:hypothetical protein